MREVFTDQMGRKVEVNIPPRRIVSLVPSQTELLFYLGLDEEIVGITKFCVHPKEKWREKPRVGGTKKLHLDKIAALNPSLIIGNKEENQREQIEALEKSFPVWMSDISTLEDALEMIEMVGKMVQKPDKAVRLVRKIRTAFRQLPATPQIPATYFIWRKPWMVAAAGTFIDNMMNAAGFQNIFAGKQRYPEISLDELVANKPEVILLSSEPYPFSEKHFEEIKHLCPDAAVMLADGEMFSWYGSRLLLAAPYFVKLRSAAHGAK